MVLIQRDGGGGKVAVGVQCRRVVLTKRGDISASHSKRTGLEDDTKVKDGGVVRQKKNDRTLSEIGQLGTRLLFDKLIGGRND